MTMPTDIETNAWIRNPGDEKAVANGCTFDMERAAYAVWWIEYYCSLYEGEWAGDRLWLRGCQQCDAAPAELLPWEEGGREATITRLNAHAKCHAAGHALDWQLECVARLFGWVRFDKHWGRPVRRFRQASIWVPKKSKKSPTLAAIGLYLLVGDNEQGQKVFLCAKDGTQAREIAGKHTVEMLQQSPDLMEECTLNKSLLQITHTATRSILRPLSSSGSRTKESKEGLNGSVLIDETHVVDKDFVDRISRAGISRSEPLHIEVSTAGNNPEGYGKKRFDYASDVLKGTIVDEELFVAIYAAPQDLKDSDLCADPIKYGRMANPAFGHTVSEDEFLKDFERSKRSISELSNFKMYRLNIWQKATNPWLKADDWDACRNDFKLEDMAGQICFMGIDLSETDDMSAMVLLFPQESGNIRIFPWFWLPEESARARNHLASFLNWAGAGHLELCPGRVIDYGYIRKKAREMKALFDVRYMTFDPWHGDHITREICDGIIGADGSVLEEGTGIERSKFPQNISIFAKPTAEFERLVLNRQLEHNGHPVLDWQAGHVEVWRDASGNKRPMKPKSNDVRKVDGIVAAVMALGLYLDKRDELVTDASQIIMVA